MLQSWLPESKVVKGFNTTIGATLQSGKIGDLPTTVLLASDNQEAKGTIKEALAGSPLRVFDAGALKRARELEVTGFLQMTLAVSASLNKSKKEWVHRTHSFLVPKFLRIEILIR
ncbi:hypothetical protein, partial [Lactobacillus delbrueckii]